MKKLALLLISLLVIVLIAAGCQKESKSSQTTSSKPKTSTKKKSSGVSTQASKPKIIKKKKTPEKKSIGDMDSDGKKFGYIKSVYLFNKTTPYLEIDYAQMLYGEEAQKAAAAEGHEMYDMDFYISNVNPKMRTFEISADAKFIMQTWKMASEGKVEDTVIDFNDFLNVFNSDSQNAKRMAASPYWIVLENNKVVKITEQFLP